MACVQLLVLASVRSVLSGGLASSASAGNGVAGTDGGLHGTATRRIFWSEHSCPLRPVLRDRGERRAQLRGITLCQPCLGHSGGRMIRLDNVVKRYRTRTGTHTVLNG